MLILTRRVGERLMIGDDIVIKVIRVDGNQVRIGIDAPPHVRIVREEIKDKPMKERERPASRAYVYTAEEARMLSHLVIGQCPYCSAINGHEPNCSRKPL